MKNHANRHSVSGKAFAAVLALALVLGCALGGTVAWLVANSDTVTNTFTYGDINIALTETKPVNREAKIIPGMNIEKDPKVTVKANSEACWLFVKVEEAGTFVDDKVTYSIADGWTALPGQSGVYYREVGAVTADTDFYALKGNVVKVSDTLTKEDIKDIPTGPTLTFTAYAVQKDGITDAATAWAKVNATSSTTPTTPTNP